MKNPNRELQSGRVFTILRRDSVWRDIFLRNRSKTYALRISKVIETLDASCNVFLNTKQKTSAGGAFSA